MAVYRVSACGVSCMCFYALSVVITIYMLNDIRSFGLLRTMLAAVLWSRASMYVCRQSQPASVYIPRTPDTY